MNLAIHYHFKAPTGHFWVVGRKIILPTQLWDVWYWMRKRCRNPPGHPKWHLYAGKGIKVCDRWKDFENFAEDMEQGWFPGLTLDRINSDGNYEPGNCHWATHKQQMRNRRNNFIVDTPRGRMCLVEASEVSGLSGTILKTRMKRGVPVEHMFDPKPPPHPKVRKPPRELIHIDTPVGFIPLVEAAKLSGINARTLQMRIKSGVLKSHLFDEPNPFAGQFKRGNKIGNRFERGNRNGMATRFEPGNKWRFEPQQEAQ